MQCIWTSTSSVLRRRACPAATTLRFAQPAQRRNISFNRFVSDAGKARFASLADAFVSTAIRDTAIAPVPLPVLDLPREAGPASPQNTNKPLTSAQLSRAAAQSVRLACQKHSSREAFLIVKALQASLTQYPSSESPRALPPARRASVAIDFGQAVSPRLALHSLLHGLVRRGMTKKAGRVAWQLLRGGIPVHERTLACVTGALCSSDVAALRDAGFREQLRRARATLTLPGPEPPDMKALKPLAPCTRLAFQLFAAARQYERQRAGQMFQQLVDACLLQGEILVVSFLFAFLVKQWQVRHALANVDCGTPLPEVDAAVCLFDLTSKRSSELASAKASHPSQQFMLKALENINAAIFNTPLPDPSAIPPSFEEAAQALAVFADMLGDNALPYKNLSALVSTLCTFPAAPPVRVYTRRKGRWKLRDARAYFDEVLDSLVQGLAVARHPGDGALQFDLRTYNALLHYALRRKLSPELGESIFRRMLGKGPRLQPDITTYNTQLRAATLFRRNDMAAKILQMLRERTENAEHSIMYKPHREVKMELSRKDAATPERQKSLQIIRPEEATSSISISTQDQGTADSNVSSLPGDVNHGSTISSDSTLRANESTLSIYIAHLTATGDPQVVAKLLFFLIPELRIIDHPAHPLAADTQAGMPRQEACALSRHTAVQRAIGLGPRFFTAVLNALAKAHQTGLAERVWLLARTAERRSWDARFAGAARPWVLPVAAYTIMMQCYAEEARRGINMQRGAPGPVLGQWTPQTPARVKGWALFVLRANRQRCAELGPAEASRQMGAVLFRAMHAAGRDLYELVLAQAAQGGTQPTPKGLQPPVPDARFFNAALELFARVPGRGGSVRRGVQMTGPPALWMRLNRREFGRFVRRGHSSYSREPYLFGVVQAMAKAGFEVPVAFRRMFIGYDVPEAMRDPAQNRQKPSPYAAGRKERPAAPHRLPIFKTRGLPLRRRKLKIRRGRGSSSSSSV